MVLASLTIFSLRSVIAWLSDRCRAGCLLPDESADDDGKKAAEEDEAGMGETEGDDGDVGVVEADGDLNEELMRIDQGCFGFILVIR